MVLIRKGDAGNIVGQIHQALMESGATIDAVELTTQKFGDTTFAAVVAFQAHHVGSNGHALTQDGVVGPETLYALQHPAHDNRNCIALGWNFDLSIVRPELEPVLKWAAEQIGTVEEPPGSNRGSLIDQWTSMVGVDPTQVGPPWCAFFASAAYSKCVGGPPFGTIGASWRIAKWGLTHGRLVGIGPLQPGDIGVILRGPLEDEPHGHTVLIVSGNETACTIEGNSGQAVRGLLRPRSTFSYVIRPLV
jgi:hypothetical protein